MEKEKLYKPDCIDAIKKMTDTKLWFMKNNNNMVGFEKNEKYFNIAFELLGKIIDKE